MDVILEGGTADFGIESIGIVEITDEIANGAATIDYPITACLCGEDGNACTLDPLLPNTDLRLCVFPTSNEVEIVGVTSLALIQEPLTIEPIKDSTAGTGTTVTLNQGGAIVVTRPLVNFFLDAVNNPDLAISGSVLLAFVSTETRRGRRQLIRRSLEPEMLLISDARDGESTASDGPVVAGNANFGTIVTVKVPEEEKEPDDASTASSIISSLVCGGITAVVASVAFI